MWDKPPTPAETAVLDAVTNAIVTHLRDRADDPGRGSDTDPQDADVRRGRDATGGHASRSEDGEQGQGGRDSGLDPVLIQVDGPGRTLLLRRLGETLDPTWESTGARPPRPAVPRRHDDASPDPPSAPADWVAISFDAWRHQRVAPPWWWLMSALDTQIRACLWRTGWRSWGRQRAADWGGRGMRLGRDLLWVLPGALALFVGLQLSPNKMLEYVKWLTTVAGSILALLALVSTVGNALRRHLLARSPRGASALLRSSDPMAELLRRYNFLVRSARRPIVVLIDNLDRCRADYVVEMLEGIQTLLKDPLTEAPRREWHRVGILHRLRPDRPRRPFIAFVVAADRGWLCESYLHVYDEFKSSIKEPGRPFGLLFVDKVFDVALRIPTVPASMALEKYAGAGPANAQGSENPFTDLDAELLIRLRLGVLEGSAPDSWSGLELRRHAVQRLADVEVAGDRKRRQCGDTRVHLDEALAQLNPGSTVQRQLDVAYCVKRTTQLLAGHEIDDDDHAIKRLALWTIIELKWPLLAAHLSREPNDVRVLDAREDASCLSEDLRAAVADPLAQRIAGGVGEGDNSVTLSPKDIVRFTMPTGGRTPAAPHTSTRFTRAATAPAR